jgi:hypothetical protein
VSWARHHENRTLFANNTLLLYNSLNLNVDYGGDCSVVQISPNVLRICTYAFLRAIKYYKYHNLGIALDHWIGMCACPQLVEEKENMPKSSPCSSSYLVSYPLQELLVHLIIIELVPFISFDSRSTMTAVLKLCGGCAKDIYPMEEQVNCDGKKYHKSCCKCHDCGCQVLSLLHC